MNPFKQEADCLQFKALHAAGNPLIMPNAWDAMSAKLLEQCGFQAIGTTSAGIAASLGYADGEAIGMDEMLDAAAHIAASVQVPVSADLEAGYGCTPDTVGQLAVKAANAGVAGLNIEDGVGIERQALLDADYQASRLMAIKDAAATFGLSLFVNARIDTYWYRMGSEEWRLEETIRRAELYRLAGADGIFVPGVADLDTIRSLTGRIALPLNVLAAPGTPDIATLAGAGVARVSTGSGPYRAAMSALRDFGNELIGQGTYSALSQGTIISYNDMYNLLSRRSGENGA